MPSEPLFSDIDERTKGVIMTAAMASHALIAAGEHINTAAGCQVVVHKAFSFAEAFIAEALAYHSDRMK